MSYRVRVPARVQKRLDALPDTLYDRVREQLRELATNPPPSGVVKLTGTKSRYRVRVGSHRIVYDIDDAAREILVITVADRKDVYR